MKSLSLHIVSFTGNSGLADYALSLHQQLSKFYKSTLIINKNFSEQNVLPKIEKIFGRTRYYPISFLLFLAREILLWRPNVLVFQSWLKFPLMEALGVRVLKLSGAKLLLTVHDTLPHYPKPWSRWAVRHFFSAFDGLVAHSTTSAVTIREMGYKGKVTVIPHGSYSLFNKGRTTRAEARAKLGLADSTFAVLFFGHVEERKGCFEFVEAAQRFSRHEAAFLVAGQLDLGAAAARKFSEAAATLSVLPMLKRVPEDQVEVLFRAADLVALPYREGSTSGVFKLAVEFGVPVACTEVGDLGEAVKCGTALGIPVEGGIASGLADVVRRMIDNPDLRTEYGARMNEERSRTSWMVVGEQYAQFIDSI